jgi:hypothetical protein
VALIHQDLVSGTGDELITLDTDTHLEWLDLTATANLSYLEVLAGAGGYTTAHGFRYATGEEIGLLLQHAGVTKFGPGQNVPSPESNHLAIKTLIDLMGGITRDRSVASVEGLVQTQGMLKFRGPGIPTATTPMSVSQLWLFKNNPASSYADTNPAGQAGKGSPEIGSYLVRNQRA